MSDGSALQPTATVTGTADSPDLRRRPIAFIAFVLLYAAFIALLIAWALKLRHAH